MKSKPSVKLSQSCDLFVRDKQASGKSKYTIRNYWNTFAKLKQYLGDPQFCDINRAQLVDFFVWLQEEYVSEPDGAAPRGKIKLSAKSVRNAHSDLSALWQWAAEKGVVPRNLIRDIQPPKVNPPAIEPLTQAEVESLLRACSHSRSWKSRPQTMNSRPTAARDRAIVMVMLDCGLRAQEVCDLTIGDVNLAASSITVVGKGNKPRTVAFGKRCAKALAEHIIPLLAEHPLTDPLFIVGADDEVRPLTRDHLRKLLARLGESQGIHNVHPHLLRHTFAVNFLRNGASVFHLQEMLGHADLAMCRRYVRLAEADLKAVQSTASVVDNWKLK